VRVYLAGPPFAEEYRRRAAELVHAAGWEAVDPMRRDFRGRTEGREAEIVSGDLADIDSCDAVLAAFTHGAGKRVVAYTGGTPPHPWTVYVADAVAADLDDAVTALASAP
jgi:nucleoside 2-deoxyribosyltransferase